MKILAMDSAAAACSVALWQDDNVTHHCLTPMSRGHASALVPMIDTLMQDASLAITDLDGFGVSVGPGGFTGLRIALATARGFGVATKKPVVGITTLGALAAAIPTQETPILCALDAKRADLYGQLFSGAGHPLSPPLAQLPESYPALLNSQSLSHVTLVGDSSPRLIPFFEEAGITVSESAHKLPDAYHIATLAAQRLAATTEISRPEPLYIRPPDAAIPKNGGRLRP